MPRHAHCVAIFVGSSCVGAWTSTSALSWQDAQAGGRGARAFGRGSIGRKGGSGPGAVRTDVEHMSGEGARGVEAQSQEVSLLDLEGSDQVGTEQMCRKGAS